MHMKARTHALLTPLSILVLCFNVVMAVVGAASLALLGRWLLVVGGLGAGVIATFVLMSITSSSAALAAHPRYFEKDRPRSFATTVTIGSVLWLDFTMAAWCLSCFLFVSNVYESELSWAHLLWCYAMATIPCTYLVDYDAKGRFVDIVTRFGALGACVGAAALAGVIASSPHATIGPMLAAVSIPMAMILHSQIAAVFISIQMKQNFDGASVTRSS
jgi:hypothetical protein